MEAATFVLFDEIALTEDDDEEDDDEIRKIGPGFGIRGLNYAYFCDSRVQRAWAMLLGFGMVLGCAQAFHGFPERNKNLAHGGLYAQFSFKKSFEGGNEKYFGCAGL